MDMEADLGIDSIKRVEILGALRDMYPNFPQSNMEELGELRTIGHVVEYLQSQTSQIPSPEVVKVSAVKELETQKEQEQKLSVGVNALGGFPLSTPQSPLPTFNSQLPTPNSQLPTPPSQLPPNSPDFGQTLLAITSDKTGYPIEMLEMDMDMEADLGIDSIKRVEILGTMQEIYPDLPKPSVEELGELRTIGQIVEYLQNLAGGEKKNSQSQFDKQLDNVNQNIQRFSVKLKNLPPPDSLDFTLPEGHVALITDDGSLTTSKLAYSLTEQGWKVVVLSFPQSLIPQQSPLPKGMPHVTLTDLSEEHLQQKLQAIATNFGKIGAFIHLHPMFAENHIGKISYLKAEKAIVKHVFLMAKHLKQSLNEAAHYGRSCFCTVAHLDGAFGLEHQVNFGAIGAGLFGLTKSLRWEWPQVFTRAIDLSPTLDAQQSIPYIIAELHDPNLYISEVAYGSQGRVTLCADIQVV